VSERVSERVSSVERVESLNLQLVIQLVKECNASTTLTMGEHVLVGKSSYAFRADTGC
jgi:hypothetical protein